jgi:HK97 family phage major capsid protein
MKKVKERFNKRLRFLSVMILAICGFMFLASIQDVKKTGGAVLMAAPLFLAGITMSGKSLEELRELKGKAVKQLDDIVEKCQAEKRDLNAEEIETRNDLVTSIRKINSEIEAEEFRQEEKRKAAGKSFKKNDGKDPEEREVEKYSFTKAIRARVEGRSLDGIELEMHQEAEKEARACGMSISGIGVSTKVLDNIAKRAMTATGSTSVTGDQGGMLIPTEIEGLVMALRPQLVLAGLGAKTFGNMVGNLDIVKGTSTSASWKAENADLDETDADTSVITVSPKRLGALTKLSKQWLIQTNRAFESQVISDILAAIAQAVELAAINGTGSGNNQPTGILGTSGIGSVVGGTNGLAPTYAHICELESKLDIANVAGMSLAFLTNPKVKNKLRTTKLDDGSGMFVWPQLVNELNGQKTAVSNLVPSTLTKGTSTSVCSAIVFGDFSGLQIYNWGGLDMIVDPYTSKTSGQIEISVDSFWDTAIPEPKRFAAMLDALTA